MPHHLVINVIGFNASKYDILKLPQRNPPPPNEFQGQGGWNFLRIFVHPHLWGFKRTCVTPVVKIDGATPLLKGGHLQTKTNRSCAIDPFQVV